MKKLKPMETRKIETLYLYLDEDEQSEKSYYWDFKISGIKGVFRSANSDGIDKSLILQRVEQNRDFFVHVATVGARQIIKESSTTTNWGNGWEWGETRHPKQAHGYRLRGPSISWFTCPFGGKIPGICSMNALYGKSIEPEGIDLLYSWDHNREPSTVCYFFPTSKDR